MGQVIETIGKAVTAPFKFIGDVITDPGHIGDHLQNFGSSVTGGLIPPKEKEGEKPAGTETPPSEEQVKGVMSDENHKAHVHVNEIMSHFGFDPVDFHDENPPGNSTPNTPFAPPPPGSSYTITVTAPKITNLR